MQTGRIVVHHDHECTQLKIETDLHLLPKRIDVSLDEDNDKEVLGKNGEDHVYDQDDDDAN